MSFREAVHDSQLRPWYIEYNYSPFLSIEAIKSGYTELNSNLNRPVPNLDALLLAVKERMLHTDVKMATRELNLNESEVLSILVYTADWTHFGISLEESLPCLLNHHKNSVVSRKIWRPFFFHLLKGLEKLPLFQGWAFKGIKSKLSFLSRDLLLSLTTSEPELNDSIQTLLKINVSNGRMLGVLSMSPLEGELLIIPYSHYNNFNQVKQGTLDILTCEQEYTNLILKNPFIAAKEGNLNDLQSWYIGHNSPYDDYQLSIYGNVFDAEHNNASLLYTAARFGQAGFVKFLLQMNVDVNVVQNQGSSALHAAAYYGHFEVVKILVESGIDVNIKNKWHCTALGEVRNLVRNGQQWKDIVYYLENLQGQDPKSQTNNKI